MSAAASRMLWVSSAAGSLVIHAGFALAALSLVPWAHIAPPKPESEISVADMAAGFAADIAKPVAAVPQVLAPAETVAAIQPAEALAPLGATIAASVPTPPLTAKPVANATSATVASAQIAAAAPVTTARPLGSTLAVPAEVPETVAAGTKDTIAAAAIPKNAAISVAETIVAPALISTPAQASSVASISAAAVAVAPVAVPMAPAAAGAISLPTAAIAAPIISAASALPSVVVAGGTVAHAPAPTGNAAPVSGGAVVGSIAAAGVVAPRMAGSPQIAGGAVSGPNAGVAVQPSVATALRAGGTAVAPASPQTLVAAVPQAAAIVALPEPAQVPEASAVLPGLGEMSAFIDAHSDQACLAAVAETDTSGIAMMTGYGTVATLDGFAAEARAQFGAALSIDARVISPGQCWLLDMLGAWRRYWDPEFDIVLTNEQVPSGGTVRATITNVGGTWLYVLLVDDEGKVSDLADYLIARDDVVSLAAPVTATGTGEYRLQLLVAITTETSLVSIDQHRGEAAQSFFAALQQELKTRQIRPQLSVTAFKVY